MPKLFKATTQLLSYRKLQRVPAQWWKTTLQMQISSTLFVMLTTFSGSSLLGTATVRTITRRCQFSSHIIAYGTAPSVKAGHSNMRKWHFNNLWVRDGKGHRYRSTTLTVSTLPICAGLVPRPFPVGGVSSSLQRGLRNFINDCCEAANTYKLIARILTSLSHEYLQVYRTHFM